MEDKQQQEDRSIALLWLAGGFRLMNPPKDIWEAVREILLEREEEKDGGT